MPETTQPFSPLEIQQAQSDEILKTAYKAISKYNADVLDDPTYPTSQALESLNLLKEPLPSKSSPPSGVLSLLTKLGEDTAIPTTGGRFFGFVAGGVLPTGLAARLLSDAWDQSSALHTMSPLAAELEQICETWLVELFCLPKDTVAGFVTGTSMATLCAFAAARYHLLSKVGWDIDTHGLFGAPDLRIIVNENAHSCVRRSLRLIGFGERHIEWVTTDDEGRIIVDALPKLDDRCILIMQAGDVNTGAFDPFDDICSKAKNAGAWVHVDGAFGLWAAASPKFKALTRGIEKADSWACDAHKTLNAPYDSGIIFCRQTQSYRAAMATGAAYAPMADGKRDGMAFVPEMSRRARAVEIWAILKTLGREGVAELVEQLCNRASLMVTLLKDTPATIINDVVFNQVLIQGPTDEDTRAWLTAIQSSGEFWCSGSKWKGRDVIRFSICSWRTSEADIYRSADCFKSIILS